MRVLTFLIIYFQQARPTIEPDAKKNGSALKYFCQNEGSGGSTLIPSSGILTNRKQIMAAVKDEPQTKYGQFDILNLLQIIMPSKKGKMAVIKVNNQLIVKITVVMTDKC